MKVVVYVEGPGGRARLETLLRPLIEAKEAAGVQVAFIPMTRGDRKTALLTHAPVKAANAVLNDPELTVIVLPDLYPANKAFEQATCGELQEGVMLAFRKAVAAKQGRDERIAQRFRVFCMIHDLEVLLLAAEEQLVQRCRLAAVSWTKPVEQQNHDEPPKRIVERLIPGYSPVVDGPLVLATADYRVISARCPNGFGRFVAFLESV